MFKKGILTIHLSATWRVKFTIYTAGMSMSFVYLGSAIQILVAFNSIVVVLHVSVAISDMTAVEFDSALDNVVLSK